jgi:hypothetical protein
MSSEHQTVDHANMGNDRVMISSSHDTAPAQRQLLEIQEDYSSSTSGCLRNATHAAVYAPQQAKLVAGSPAEEGSHSPDGNELSGDEQQQIIPPNLARLFGADLHRAKLSDDQHLADHILLTEGHTQHIGLSFLFRNVLQYMHIACSMCAHHKLI